MSDPNHADAEIRSFRIDVPEADLDEPATTATTIGT